jgi:putative drug exporter of the RND superfamily
MSSYLYRIGRFACRRRRAVLAFWLAALIGLGLAAGALRDETSDEFTVPGTPAQDALDLLDEKFPGAGGGSARIVFATPEGERVTDPENRAAIEETVARAAEVPQAVAAVDPFEAQAISENGRIAFADVPFEVAADAVEDSSRDQLEASVEPAREAGMDVEFSGGVVRTEAEEPAAEAIGIVVAFVVLFVMFASFLAAGLPLIIAIVGVSIGGAALQALTGFVELNSTAPVLASMLGLAVGIDYTLFILSRHKQQLADGLDVEESIARATATAGGAVVFAGLTVVIALIGLSIMRIPFLTVMGLAAAGTVSIAVLIAITLLPALLGFSGERMARSRRKPAAAPRGPAAGRRWAELVTRRPVPVLAVGLIVLLVLAMPALDLRLALPDDGSDPEENTERRAYDLLTAGFGPGFNGPLTGVVDASESEIDPRRVIRIVAREAEQVPNVVAVSEPATNESGEVAVITLTPRSGPADDETKDLVEEIRRRADEIPEQAGVSIYVTGTTALNIDVSDRLTGALPLFIIVVVGLALLLLTAVFRSILVPLKAAGGFLLSIAASLGVVTFVFQKGNLADLLGVAVPGPIISFLPVLLIGVLFGLAMDYEVFLVSRMRERYVHSGDAREAIVTGFAQSARVVTAAGIIMIAVFAGFVVSPDPVTKSIGFSLAVGVLVDAFVVRMTLVPAVMALLGPRAWWIPKGLDRRLPNLDIEGERLEHDLEAAARAEQGPTPVPSG